MRTISKNQILVLNLLLFFMATMLVATPNSFAQPKDCNQRISGHVTLDGTTPDRRVDVHLLSEQNKERTVRTDNEGLYVFDRVCPGSYRVRPGPAWMENVVAPSRYTPGSREVVIQRQNRLGGAANGAANVDFMRRNPPRQDEPTDQGNFIDDQIKVDESMRASRDLHLARQVELFLEKTLPCKQRLCDLTIQVSNGRVVLAGIIEPEDRPLLSKIREKVRGVRAVNLAGVRSKEQP